MKKLFFALLIAAAASSTVKAQTKIAHVNTQALLDTLPSRKKTIEDINFLEKKGIEELTMMDEAVKKAYEEYSKLAPGSQPNVVQYSQERVAKAQQALETRQQELEQNMQIKTQELNDRTLKAVKEAVDIVAKKKGINYVIDQAGALFSAGTDITNEVIAELLKIDARTATPATPK